MYDIQNIDNVERTLIRAIEGSVFEAEYNGAEGVMIFVPCGLTGLRVNAKEYVNRFSDVLENRWIFPIYRRRAGTDIVTCMCDWNKKGRVYTHDDVAGMVDYVLTMFDWLGISRIAMNGIRCEGGSRIDVCDTPEAYLVYNVMHWLINHYHRFESIDFVDLRNGFSNVDFERIDNELNYQLEQQPMFHSRREVFVDDHPTMRQFLAIEIADGRYGMAMISKWPNEEGCYLYDEEFDDYGDAWSLAQRLKWEEPHTLAGDRLYAEDLFRRFRKTSDNPVFEASWVRDEARRHAGTLPINDSASLDKLRDRMSDESFRLCRSLVIDRQNYSGKIVLITGENRLQLQVGDAIAAEVKRSGRHCINVDSEVFINCWADIVSPDSHYSLDEFANAYSDCDLLQFDHLDALIQHVQPAEMFNRIVNIVREKGSTLLFTCSKSTFPTDFGPLKIAIDTRIDLP